MCVLDRFDEELDKSDLLTLDNPRGMKVNPSVLVPSGPVRGGRDMRTSMGKATWK